MDRWIRILAVVLGVQVVLAAWLWWDGEEAGSTDGESVFLDWNPEEVTELTIESGGDGEADAVTLRRTDQGWVIARLDDLPAAGTRIDDLLRELHEARQGLAVGTTAAALERFRVAEDRYALRLTLNNAQGESRVIYVGESAGPGRVYARRAQWSTAHELPVRRYELGTGVRDWADKDLLRVRPAEIRRLVVDDSVALVRVDDGWVLEGAEDRRVDQEEAQRLVDRLARIPFDDVVPNSEARVGEELLTIRIERKEGEPVVYHVYSSKEDGERKGPVRHLLQVEGRPWWFVVPGYAIAPAVDVDRKKLLVETPGAGEEAGEADQATPGDGDGTGPAGGGGAGTDDTTQEP